VLICGTRSESRRSGNQRVRAVSEAGIGCTTLDDGFRSCDDPQALQRICGRLGPGSGPWRIRFDVLRLDEPLESTRPPGSMSCGAEQ